MADQYRDRPYPSSQRDERIETGVEDLARMNKNKRIRDSGTNAPHLNPDDTGRYERKDHRTPERKRENPIIP